MDNQPNPKKLYGILHDLSGKAILKNVRILKVSFGIPMGPDVNVWIGSNGKWTVDVGVYKDGKRQKQTDIKEFSSKEEAQEYYLQARTMTPDRTFPRKFPFFSFLRMDAEGNYSHDFDAIEQHGPIPSEIPIVFLTNDPFEHPYQNWAKSDLRCYGDGLNALRKLDMASGAEEKQLAEEARAKGERYFSIVGGCATGGCPYARGDKPACKPHGKLLFQLVNKPVLGGTCTYDTTGKKSIEQIYNCIQEIKTITGNGDPERGYIAGVPLAMLVRPYKTNHNNQPSMQYAVSLEFRAPDVNATELTQVLIQHAQNHRRAQLGAAPLQIAEPLPEGAEAAAMTAEFYGDFDEDDEVYNAEIVEPTKMPRRASEVKATEQVQQKSQPVAEVMQEPTPEPAQQKPDTAAGSTPEPSPTAEAQLKKEVPVEVKSTIVRSPTVKVSAAPYHMIQLKKIAGQIGEKRLIDILGIHGIEPSNVGKTTLEQFNLMKPDLDNALDDLKGVG